MERLRFRRSPFALLLAVVAAVALGACGEDDTATGPGGVGTVRPVVLEGTQMFPLTIMRSKGIAEKHKLKVEPQVTAGPEAVYTRMQTPDFQIAFGTWAKAVQLAQSGTKVVNVFSMYGYSNSVLVAKDSPLRSIGDLEGKKIGLFGGPGSGTTLLFRLLAKRFYGFDPQTEAKIHYGAPGLLAGQLERGDIDAALLLDPIVQKTLAAGKTRELGPDIGTDWNKRTGQRPLLVAMQMNSDWAKDNPDVARRFVAAFSEALTYIDEHPEVWPELAESVGLKDPESVEHLRRKAEPTLVNDWSQKLIDEQVAFGKLLVDTFGESRDFPTTIPRELFTREFVPKAAAPAK